MKTEYNIEMVNKSINTTSVKVLIEDKAFNQMWKEADKRLKSSINRFYENFKKNL
jgi:hypothetical protein